MADEKNRGGLEDRPFDYRESKDGKVFIHWRGSEVMVLAGRAACKFVSQIQGKSPEAQQLLMAKTTKNFKRGNE